MEQNILTRVQQQHTKPSLTFLFFGVTNCFAAACSINIKMG